MGSLTNVIAFYNVLSTPAGPNLWVTLQPSVLSNVRVSRHPPPSPPPLFFPPPFFSFSLSGILQGIVLIDSDSTVANGGERLRGVHHDRVQQQLKWRTSCEAVIREIPFRLFCNSVNMMFMICNEN